VIRGRELIIVPDGVLHTLAFEALVASEVNHGATSARPVYLVERHVITYAPSISVLTEIERRRQTAKPNDHILLVGDPVFSGSDSPWAPANQPATNQEVLMAMGRRERFGGGLTPLPATRQEVMEIARLAERHNWTRTVLLGREASEERLTSSELSSYRVLHLATHAVADDKAGGFSALALSLDEKPAGGDGVWTAAEIARMKLTADLVVVSGCETGTGQEAKAEGVIGLSRAFMVAGAQRVCGSIWKVEDTATQKLMTTFYDGLLTNGLAASRALQQAKLAMLRSGAAPFYWAPFILVGPPR
jgi:CHAT domain-containing protein